MVNYTLTLDQRIERAMTLHKSGYNCAQCVFMAFDDIHGLPIETAAKVSAGFGGGIGGLREICGAVSGMIMILGMNSFDSPADKPAIYTKAKEYCQEFKAKNGSYICRELLKPGRKPCSELIADAISIIDRKLQKQLP